MARTATYQQAINEALAQEMARDETVIVMGEDVAGGLGTDGERDAWGGPLGITKGLYGKYGDRIMDTPISESAFIGAAVGAATAGLRPVAELMFIDFMGVCFDQIFNQAAKFRYMFGGKAETPVVIRTMYGAGLRAAAQHSQCLYPVFTHIPGLKVVTPATPYDAKGLLIQAIRDNDPVIFCEHKALYTLEGDVPEEPYALPFGEANIVREGDDVSIVTLGRMVHVATEAAEALSGDGIECECRRPAHDLAAGRGHRARDGGEHRTAGGARRGAPALQHRHRHRGDGLREGLRFAQGADQAGVRPAHAGALRRHAGGSLHPRRGRRAEGREGGHGVQQMSDAIRPICMPKWGLSMKEGKVAGWLVGEGDALAPGDEIVDIETEKISSAVEAPDAGVLRRHVAQEGDVLPVGGRLPPRHRRRRERRRRRHRRLRHGFSGQLRAARGR